MGGNKGSDLLDATQAHIRARHARLHAQLLAEVQSLLVILTIFATAHRAGAQSQDASDAVRDQLHG